MNKFNLLLGSGGVRGVAHIGVLKFLEEKKLVPDLVVGNSMGALVGALYCNGYSFEKIKKLLLTNKTLKLIDFYGFSQSIISGRNVDALLKRHLDVDFKDLKIPLIVNAVDILTGEEVVLKEGKVWEAVRASISIIGVFRPVEKGKHFLVDAGFTNPVPFNLLTKSKQLLIVDVSTDIKPIKKDSSVFNILSHAMEIAQRNSAKRLYKLYLNSPHKAETIHYLDLDMSDYFALNFAVGNDEFKKIIEFGYSQAKHRIKGL